VVAVNKQAPVAAPAIDGRWCGECGGNLDYRRFLRSAEIVTVLWCWSCGARTEVATYPYHWGQPAEESASPWRTDEEAGI
jgi:hypothetical protein